MLSLDLLSALLVLLIKEPAVYASFQHQALTLLSSTFHLGLTKKKHTQLGESRWVELPNLGSVIPFACIQGILPTFILVYVTETARRCAERAALSATALTTAASAGCQSSTDSNWTGAGRPGGGLVGLSLKGIWK